MESEPRIKSFAMSHLLVERDLDKIEKRLRLDLQRGHEDGHEDQYYPQFDLALRSEAHDMGRHYELFYCLEKSIRRLISETLEAVHGEKWWEKSVPEAVKTNVKNCMKRELDSGITVRSDDEIDYTDFGELGEIVRNNWSSFDGVFSSEKAFTRIMTILNMLRNPIAHCCPFAEDEVIRLQLTVKDWFRLME